MTETKIMNQEEYFHEISKNDSTYELAKRIAKHIQNWYTTKEIFHKKEDKIDFLKLASDVRICLNDSTLSKRIEDRLLEDFKKELKEARGITPENESYIIGFGELGIELHNYNIDLLEKVNFKKVLLNQILQTKSSILQKSGFEVDSYKNVFFGIGDMTECYCTKESIMKH